MAITPGSQILAADVNEILDHSFLALGDKMASLPVASMTTGVEGTGVASLVEAGARLQTGGTAAGRGFAYFGIYGLGEAKVRNIDWDKKLHLQITISRDTASANSLNRIQLKANTNEADLGGDGIGIVIKNYDLYAESFNTGRAETAFAVTATMADSQQYVIDIVHTPGTDVKFYLDEVLQVTHAVAANVPAGEVDSNHFLIFSVDNQADNLDAEMFIGFSVLLWQEET